MVERAGRDWRSVSTARSPGREDAPRRRQYDAAVRASVRLALVVLGLAVAVYGTASLTGGWLGTPPWWTKVVPSGLSDWEAGLSGPEDEPPFFGFGNNIRENPKYDPVSQYFNRLWRTDPVPGREWISGGVVAAGAALVGFGAWPRRRRPPTTT